MEKVIIKKSSEGVLSVGAVSGVITLSFGENTISGEDWAKISDHPVIKGKIDRGELVRINRAPAVPVEEVSEEKEVTEESAGQDLTALEPEEPPEEEEKSKDAPKKSKKGKKASK